MVKIRAAKLEPESGSDSDFNLDLEDGDSEAALEYTGPNRGRTRTNAMAGISIDGQTVYPCPKCGRNFVKPKSQEKHTLLCTNLQCEICHKIFKSAPNLAVHMDGIHSDERKHQCKECDKSFRYSSQLHQHRREHHTAQTPAQCTVCHKIFRSAFRLKLHTSTTHSGTRLGCSICNQTFKHKQAYNRHMRTIHTEERSWACHHCDKVFKARDLLVGHIRTHTKPFQCGVCEEVFSRKPYLKKHMQKHEPSENARVSQRVVTDMLNRTDDHITNRLVFAGQLSASPSTMSLPQRPATAACSTPQLPSELVMHSTPPFPQLQAGGTVQLEQVSPGVFRLQVAGSSSSENVVQARPMIQPVAQTMMKVQIVQVVKAPDVGFAQLYAAAAQDLNDNMMTNKVEEEVVISDDYAPEATMEEIV